MGRWCSLGIGLTDFVIHGLQIVYLGIRSVRKHPVITGVLFLFRSTRIVVSNTGDDYLYRRDKIVEIPSEVTKSYRSRELL